MHRPGFMETWDLKQVTLWLIEIFFAAYPTLMVILVKAAVRMEQVTAVAPQILSGVNGVFFGLMLLLTTGVHVVQRDGFSIRELRCLGAVAAVAGVLMLLPAPLAFVIVREEAGHFTDVSLLIMFISLAILVTCTFFRAPSFTSRSVA